MTVAKFIERLERECDNKEARIEVECPNGLLVTPQIRRNYDPYIKRLVGYVIHWR